MKPCLDPWRSLEEHSEELPHDFRDFRDYHSGGTLLVCGCGSSLPLAEAPERLITIGVNDVGRLFDPDYLVVLNPRQQFAGDRFQFVERSRARVVFTQLDLGIPHPHIVKLRLGHRGGTDFSDPNFLPYTRNSPYPAACLAVHMGARRIGLIGVDFTDHHFFAATGQHPLATEFAQIDQEYRQLRDACSQMGVEIFNLSPFSRLTAIPKLAYEDFLEEAVSPASLPRRKLFFVNHSFLTCGSVFEEGLAHGSERLGMESRSALCTDPLLYQKVDDFKPDLLLVVNGRRFTERCKAGFPKYKTAVWLLDEPYEVDDTSGYSTLFDHVYCNDASTLERHHNGHYLPACYDPKLHFYRPAEDRPHAVGFVGFFNPEREAALKRIARRDWLSYVVGGPWNDADLRAHCLSENIPARETANLYRGTRIILNVFRSKHHFNRCGVAATSLNPRIYEAVACGALVISEHRPELNTLCPEMPTFRDLDEMEYQIERHLGDPDLFARVRRACIRRLALHTYAARLATILETSVNRSEVSMAEATHFVPAVASKVPPDIDRATFPDAIAADWTSDHGNALVDSDQTIVLRQTLDESPGSERGLSGKSRHRNLALEFDLQLEETSVFVAKIHQAEATNQLSNSYHLMCRGARAYLARHNHVLARFTLPVGGWAAVSFSYSEGLILVRLNGIPIIQAEDGLLDSGFCFLGVKGGTARVRNISIKTTDAADVRSIPYELRRAHSMQVTPRVSIVTTVYDRVQCLERCLQSVQALNFKDYEHIVVADAPPPPVLQRIDHLVMSYNAWSAKLSFASLKDRKNDWGISPAAVGLKLACGKYLCFLSDDNGYLPNHFDKLVVELDGDPNLGFVYSSCLYAGRAILRSSSPRPAAIDLGQPLFRRELFDRHLGGSIPFREFGWDWKMIESFLRAGVRWRHVDDATFVFRLANYPQPISQALAGPSA